MKKSKNDALVQDVERAREQAPGKPEDDSRVLRSFRATYSPGDGRRPASEVRGSTDPE